MKKIIIIIFVTIFLANFVYADNINAYQNMNDDVLDKTGNGYDGTLTGTSYNAGVPIYNTSGNGSTKSLSFDATADKLTISNVGGTNSLRKSAGSVSLWIYETGGSGTQREILKDEGAGFFTFFARRGGVQKFEWVLHDGTSANYAISLATHSLNTWYHVVFKWNTTHIELYENAVLQQTTATAGGLGNNVTALQFSPDGSNDLLGRIDQYKTYDYQLTDLEINNLFNYGNITLPTVLSIDLINYTNNIHTNDEPLNFTFNVTSDSVVNCSIYINELNNQTKININSSLDNNEFFEVNNTVSGDYNWTVGCDDGTGQINATETRLLIVDRINPIWTIRTVQTDNLTFIDRELQSYIFWNDTVADTYIFAYNVSVKYPNGTIWFSNQTIDLNVTIFNYTRNVTIEALQPNGTYTANYYAEDDHTANKIPIYTHGVDSDGLSYFFDDYYIQVKTDNPNTIKEINTTKLEDRYTFNFEYKTPKNTRYYSLYSDETIYYRGNLYDYPVFVIGKNWVDFNVAEQGTTYKVLKKNNNWYQIEVTKITASNKDEIKSLGGLNIVNETYTFIIGTNLPPNITSVLPVTQNFSIDDGTQQNFGVNATDPDNDTINYEYYFNNVLVNSSQNWTWTVPFNSHGMNNMTVYAIDIAGKNDSFNWNINITNLNVEANATSISRTPTGLWYSNLPNTNFTCTGLDGDNETPAENWTVEIDYRTSIFWTSLTPIFSSNTTWVAPVNISTHEGASLDVRCRINDGFGFSDYLQVNDLVVIQEEYTPVGNVSQVSPSGVNRDFVTSVTCDTTSFGTIPSYQIRYDIDAYYNSTWHNISNGFFNKALFDMAEIDYNTNVSFRCRTTDGVTTTAFTTGEGVTRTHITNLFMFDRGNDEIEKAHKPYYKGLFADMHNEQGVTIISSYADCNGDGFWDYYFAYNDSRNTTKEHFLCYNNKGIIPHKVGIFINKTNSTNVLCGFDNTGICNIERTYDVIVK